MIHRLVPDSDNRHALCCFRHFWIFLLHFMLHTRFLHSHNATVFWLVARVFQYGWKCVLMGFKHIGVQLLWWSLLANKPTHKCLQYRLLIAGYCLCPSLVISIVLFCFVFVRWKSWIAYTNIKVAWFEILLSPVCMAIKVRFIITCIYLAYYYMIC